MEGIIGLRNWRGIAQPNNDKVTDLEATKRTATDDEPQGAPCERVARPGSRLIGDTAETTKRHRRMAARALQVSDALQLRYSRDRVGAVLSGPRTVETA
jgi:hypothetical protein